MIEIIPNWHPIFVHFTVALLSVSVGLFVVGLLFKCEQATLVAKWNLWIGGAITLLTVVAGFYAYNSVDHDTPSHLAMTEHKNLALITVAFLIPVVAWSALSHRKGQPLGVAFVALFSVAAASLATTAWHGGELVYRYGLGVMSLPKADSHDHGAHGYGEESGHDHGDAAHGHDDEMGDHHDSIDGDMMMDDMDFSGMDFEDEFSPESHDDHHHDHGDHEH